MDGWGKVCLMMVGDGWEGSSIVIRDDGKVVLNDGEMWARSNAVGVDKSLTVRDTTPATGKKGSGHGMELASGQQCI